MTRNISLLSFFIGSAMGVLLFSLPEKAGATDPEFSQYYANPLYLNPAFAGTARCPRLIMNYRNQWPGISGVTFVTYSASFDQYVDNLHGGVGLLFMNDKSGDATWTTGTYSGMYAYQLNFNRKVSLRAGFQGSYIQKSIDLSKLTFGEQIDPRFGFVYPSNEIIDPSIHYFDVSSGILLYRAESKGFIMNLSQREVIPLVSEYTGTILPVWVKLPLLEKFPRP